MIRSLISWLNTVQQLPLKPEKHGHNHYGFFTFRHARALWFSYKRFQLQLIASRFISGEVIKLEFVL